MQRIKSFLLAVIMFCVLPLPTGVFASNSEDVEGTVYQEAATVLEDLRLMQSYEDHTFKPGENITKAEFAQVIANLVNVKEMGLPTNHSAFIDVPSDMDGAEAINALAAIGLVNGNKEGFFEPFAPIHYEEAIKVILTALGYNVQAEQMGGYPIGYLSIASSKGLGGYSTGQVLTRGACAQLIYRALDIDMMTASAYGSDVSYEVLKGKTILTEKFNIFKWEGIVTANEYTGLSSADKVMRKGMVQINGTEYEAGKTNAASLLGYYITYYYKDKTDTGRPQIVSVIEKGHNDSLTIQADDIAAFNDGVYTYNSENGTDTKRASISKDAALIYNNRLVDDAANFDRSMLIPKVGEVKLLDNNGDGKYDVLFVYDYTTFVAGVNNNDNHTIYDKYNTLKTVCLSDEDQPGKLISITDADGSVIKSSDIKPEDVLTVMQSADGKIVFAIVSRKTVEGDVAEVSKDPNGALDKVMIDNTEYSVVKDYGGPDINLGINRKFYLDFMGNIAGASGNINVSGIETGYLTKMQKKDGVKNVMSFQIFTASGKLTVFDGVEKIKINGVKTDVDEIMQKCINNKTNLDRKMYYAPTDSDITVNPGNYYDQLITYKLNEEGYITEIDLSYFDTPAEGEDENSLHVAFALPKGVTQYKDQQMTFNGLGNLSSETVVFQVPPEAERRTINPDEKYFSIMPVEKAFVNDITYPSDSNIRPVEGYSISTARFDAEYVVYNSGATANASNDTTISVVDRVTTTINGDGTSVTKIYGLNNGKAFEYLCENENVYTDFVANKYSSGSQNNNPNHVKLERGDLIRYSLNTKNEIALINLVYKAGTKPMPTGSTTLNLLDSKIFGYVYDRKQNIIKVRRSDDVTNASAITLNVALSRYKVIVCDLSSGQRRIYVGTFDDILDYKHAGTSASQVVIHSRWAEGRTIFVYK